MNKNKFRVWDNKQQKFKVFNLNDVTVSNYFLSSSNIHQFIGILDKNLREIYERDVVKFSTYNREKIGEVMYSADSCAYYIDEYPIMNLSIDSLEIVGNMLEDYYYDDNGYLAKYENTNT